MTERRYDEEETAAIFARASEAQPSESRQVARRDGWTLAELQAIGREAGLAPEEVAAAARSLDQPAQPAPRRLLGITIGVGRTVQLDHRMTDAEWERLVVVLRDTFDARGQMRVDGSLRQWTNGNLQVLVEPSGAGDRISLRTRNASAQSLLTIGATVLGVTGLMALLALIRGTLGDPGVLGPLVPLVFTGVGSILAGYARLRSWAPTRLQQMDDIAARLSSGSEGDPPGRPELPR
jgi:hypothetical protein